MTRRPNIEGWHSEEDGSLDHEECGIDDVVDPDPTINFPQWSRSLLLLMDYAIIEGLQHELHSFVHYLKLAEAELAEVASRAAKDDEEPTPSQTH